MNDILSIDEENYVKPTQYTHLLKYLNSPYITLSYKTIDYFQEACKFNDTVFPHAYGEAFYPYLNTHNLLEKFGKWCTESAKLWLPSVLSVYDFSIAGTIVDIGGGEGYLLGIILSQYENLTATLLDQENIIAGAQDILAEYGVQNRVTTMTGDFFNAESLPKNQNTYILCRTLLNWSDEDARTIINNCSKAMQSDSKLLIIDFFIPEKSSSYYKRALLSDAVLLATVKSANRTILEWKTLVSNTQLDINNIYTSAANAEPEPIMPFCVFELKKS